jgi:hypothetical protein
MGSKYYWLAILMFSGLLLTACTRSDTPVIPASDQPTFLYFFTEN